MQHTGFELSLYLQHIDFFPMGWFFCLIFIDVVLPCVRLVLQLETGSSRSPPFSVKGGSVAPSNTFDNIGLRLVGLRESKVLDK